MRFAILILLTLSGLSACTSPAPRAPAQDPASRVQALLEETIDRSLNRLGQPGGMGRNQGARIDLPEELVRAEKTLRRLSLEKWLDELQGSLHRTAEVVMAPAKHILRQAAAECFVPDAALLTAGSDAITRRFRVHCDALLHRQLLPVVGELLQTHPAAAPYRRFTKRLAALDRAHEIPRPDLAEQLTRAVLDGIYRTMAEEERRARQRSGPGFFVSAGDGQKLMWKPALNRVTSPS